MKKLIRKILYSKPLSRITVKLLLFITQKAYERLGGYASVLEGGAHPKHRLINYHRFFIDYVEPDDVVLDLGCGNGLVALDVAQKARRVIGVDINVDNIKAAKESQKKLGKSNISFVVADATEVEFEEKFDKIILSNVLEHIEHRIDFLRKMQNMLKEISPTQLSNSPALLLRVPMLNRDWVTLYKRELGMEYRLDKTHYIEYTMETLKEELGKAGWFISASSVQFGEIWAVVKRCI